MRAKVGGERTMPTGTAEGTDLETYSVEEDITAILEIGHALDAVMEALGLDPLDYRKGDSAADIVRAQAQAILETIKRLQGVQALPSASDV
jgi:hypothetical protein